MLCRKPYKQGNLHFGCGQCLPCRLNHRRLWTHRIILESYSHDACCFVTLTYKDNPPNGSLVPSDAKKWLYRLRQEIKPRRVRYYLCGEYGETSQRPHYHAALFGLGPFDAEVIRRSWGKGHVHIGDLTADSAQYVAGYVTKKLTNPRDPRTREFLNGRYPEFSRKSLKPGIGALAVDKLVDALTTDHGALLISSTGDVPMALAHGRKKLPLGRYLRRKMREKYGFKETGAQEGWSLQMSEAVSQLLENAINDPEGPKAGLKKLAEARNQSMVNIENRSKIKKGGTI